MVAISNSYGGGDASDSTYGTYYNHPGIAVTASTGDNGYQGGSYPASSSYTTAVGGTSLVAAQHSRGWSETVWSGAGSGCSTYNTAMRAASSFGTGCAKRAMADVSAAADPSKGGMAIYSPTSRTARRGRSSAAPVSPRRSSPRSTRCPATPPATPTLCRTRTLAPVRRDQRQQRHLPDDPVVQRADRLGRPDRPRYAERRRRFLIQ